MLISREFSLNPVSQLTQPGVYNFLRFSFTETGPMSEGIYRQLTNCLTLSELLTIHWEEPLNSLAGV